MVLERIDNAGPKRCDMSLKYDPQCSGLGRLGMALVCTLCVCPCLSCQTGEQRTPTTEKPAPSKPEVSWWDSRPVALYFTHARVEADRTLRIDARLINPLDRSILVDSTDMRYMLGGSLGLTDVASGRSFYYGQRSGVRINLIPPFDERHAPFQEVGPGGTVDLTIEVPFPSGMRCWHILPVKTPIDGLPPEGEYRLKQYMYLFYRLPGEAEVLDTGVRSESLCTLRIPGGSRSLKRSGKSEPMRRRARSQFWTWRARILLRALRGLREKGVRKIYRDQNGACSWLHLPASRNPPSCSSRPSW